MLISVNIKLEYYLLYSFENKLALGFARFNDCIFIISVITFNLMIQIPTED